MNGLEPRPWRVTVNQANDKSIGRADHDGEKSDEETVGFVHANQDAPRSATHGSRGNPLMGEAGGRDGVMRIMRTTRRIRPNKSIRSSHTWIQTRHSVYKKDKS